MMQDADQGNAESLSDIDSAVAELRKSSRASILLVAVGAIILISSIGYSWTRLRPLDQQIAQLEKTKNEFAFKAEQAKIELARLEEQRTLNAEALDAQLTQIKATQAQLQELQKSVESLRGNMSSGSSLATALQGVETNTRDLAIKLSAINSSAVSSQRTQSAKLYYVIAMTAEHRLTIEREIQRVRKLDLAFDSDFPEVEIFGSPERLYTLLINRTPLPYPEANALKQRAISAGFGADTWLWQSDVPYFDN